MSDRRPLFATLTINKRLSPYVKRHDGGASEDVVRLRGKRLINAAETESGKKLAEGLVKRITGEDAIAARGLYRETEEFRPVGKVFLATNYTPRIGPGDAIWRRIRLIPFTVTFPEDRQDRSLRNRLVAELPGTLNWALAGCRASLEEGLGTPASVREATQEYRGGIDTVARFVDERLERDPASVVAASSTPSTGRGAWRLAGM